MTGRECLWLVECLLYCGYTGRYIDIMNDYYCILVERVASLHRLSHICCDWRIASTVAEMLLA